LGVIEDEENSQRAGRDCRCGIELSAKIKTTKAAQAEEDGEARKVATERSREMATLEKQYTGTVMSKGLDGTGPFVKLQVVNNHGMHEMEFEVEERDLELYHVGQVATMTCNFIES